MITVAELDALLRGVPWGGPSARLPLRAARGHRLVEPIHADRPLPPFDRATLDGVAVRAAEAAAGACLPVAGVIPPGMSAPALPPGSAMEIMTGAMLPSGADAVVPVEELEWIGGQASPRVHAEKARITVAPAPGQGIHRHGSDAARGAVLVPAGTRLGAAEIGVAAAVGRTELEVAEPREVRVLTTGDELVPEGLTPQPWQQRRSNAIALSALLETFGVPVRQAGHVADDPEALRRAIEAAVGSDDRPLVITGGVSQGSRDFVLPALRAAGVDILCHGVWQRPGKPIAIGLAPSGAPVFALPGNPVSALVCLRRHALHFFSGGTANVRPVPRLRVEGLDHPAAPWTRFVPVRIGDDGNGVPVKINTSGDFSALAGTAGFVECTADNRDRPVPFWSWTP